MKEIDLLTIQNGAVLYLFDEEMKKVLANIEDENTVANSVRSITIKIEIKPGKTRRTGEIKVQAYSTLAKVKPAESFLFFDRNNDGKLVALADEPGPELPGISDGSNIKQFLAAE